MFGSNHFVTRMARLGYLQGHHLKTAEWLAELPPDSPQWAILDAAWHEVLSRQQTGYRKDMRSHIMGAIAGTSEIKITDGALGLFREALNAAWRVKQLEHARAA